jgi:UDP-MurNAc hydroxylase
MEPVRITSIGHAGLYLDTAAGSILCDPWFSPAYFASWFPFPANDQLDEKLMDKVAHPDYLYVSHLHLDHFDPTFLRDRVAKSATVLLPDYPMDHLRDALTELGFTQFVPTRSGVEVEQDGLRFMIVSLTAPTDGPIGDSCLAVDDGTATFLNQNDARPPDLEALARFGSYDGHSLQFSGAIWYPMVYDLPVKAKHALGKQKRSNGMERARRYVDAVGARHVFPNSGPPAFLDDDLFALNDLADPEDNGNPFPDQTVFIDYLREREVNGVELLIPGSTAELSRTSCSVTHSSDPTEPFRDKHGYLERYQERARPLLDAERASWARGNEPLQPRLAEWWNPVLAAAPRLCAGVGDRVLLVTERERIIVDFVQQRVVPDDGLPCRYRYEIADALIRTHLRDRREDWVNGLFLSCRFSAQRTGPYNDYVYMFFKSLSPDRVRYIEEWLALPKEDKGLWRFGDRLVQRRCPHMGADLARFGHVEDGVLTCDLHGWQFDVNSGRCLTSDDVSLHTVPLGDEGAVPLDADNEAASTVDDRRAS